MQSLHASPNLNLRNFSVVLKNIGPGWPNTPSFLCGLICCLLCSRPENNLKPVYKGHSSKAENVPIMSSCLLYAGQYYLEYSLIGKMRLLFIESGLLYRGAL